MGLLPSGSLQVPTRPFLPPKLLFRADPADIDHAGGCPGPESGRDAECCTEICEIDPYCCVVVWDIVCRNKALSGDYPGCND